MNGGEGSGGGRRPRKSHILLGTGLAVALTYSCHTFFTPSDTDGSDQGSGVAIADAPQGIMGPSATRSNERGDLPAKLAAKQKKVKAYTAQVGGGSKRVWRYYLPGGIGSKALIAKLYQDSCRKNAKGQTKLRSISLWFRSAAGRHQADYQLGKDRRVTIADTTFKINGPLPRGIDSLCGLRKANESNSQFPLDQPMVKVAMALISQTAPQCQMRFDADAGFTCDLSSRTIKGLEYKLGGLQRDIIHRSKRHPYLLVRRIAVAILASRLADGRLPPARFAAERKNLCNILNYSLPLELPLALRTPLVKGHVCADKADRRELGPLIHVVASDAYREIAAVFDIYKSSSRMGKVSLKLQGERKIGRHLWMELTPVLDAGDAVRAPKPLKAKPGDGTATASFAIPSCYHPLYSASSPIYIDFVSRLMPKNDGCMQILSHQGDPLAFSRYRHEAISSETEFAISDGWSKVLSLPPGKYRYEIRPKKGRVADGQAVDRSRTVTGVIDWAAKRPHILIR